MHIQTPILCIASTTEACSCSCSPTPVVGQVGVEYTVGGECEKTAYIIEKPSFVFSVSFSL